MSGYTENAIGHNGMLDQGITLLQKPFTLPSLKEKVRAVLDSATLLRRSQCPVVQYRRLRLRDLERNSRRSARNASTFTSPCALSSGGRTKLA